MPTPSLAHLPHCYFPLTVRIHILQSHDESYAILRWALRLSQMVPHPETGSFVTWKGKGGVRAGGKEKEEEEGASSPTEERKYQLLIWGPPENFLRNSKNAHLLRGTTFQSIISSHPSLRYCFDHPKAEESGSETFSW